MATWASGEHGASLYAAVLSAGAAAWFVTRRDGPGRVRWALAAGAGSVEGDRHSGPRRLATVLRRWCVDVLGRWSGCRALGGPAGHAWWCLPGGAVLGVLGESVLPVAAGTLAVPLVARRERGHRKRQAARRREEGVIELCTAVAGELRAGRLPEAALLEVGPGALGDGVSPVLAAARFGGDVPAALRQAARLPGASGLSGAAACWQVSADSGAGLARGLDRLCGGLRAERDQRDELRAQLAGPRSTAVVLASLPAFGLLLGSAMGADPLGVLLHSPTGIGCLAAGVLLEWAGLAWVGRLVRKAEEGPGS